jgi:putrescine transport system permease protein
VIRNSRFVRLAMVAVFLFLYLPIVVLVAYSFNDSRYVTVWGGLSLKWYGILLTNREVLAAALTSLQIAALSASIATALGTLAGYALARMHGMPGRAVFAVLLIAPLVLPEVITGMSLLLMFVQSEQWIGWPAGRGMVTILLSHVTFTMPCASIVMRARFAELDPQLEEAARDLGSLPFNTFFAVTLPLALPALVASWLLCFTISLDDVVITTFASGPGSTTLPQLVLSKVRLGIDPSINALATIILSLAAMLLAVTVLARRKAPQA